MLQRSKTQKSSRRPASPAKAAAVVPGATDAATQSDVAALVDSPVAQPIAPAPETGAPIGAAAPDLAAAAAEPAAETAASADQAVPEIADPGSIPAAETASEGPAPSAETAPSAPVATGETRLVTPTVGARPSDHQPGIGALFAPRITKMMENPMQQANKAAETMMKAAEEAAEFGRGNVEAFTKATQIYVAGVQDLGKQTFAVVQGLTDHAIESAKALSGVKSLQEAVQIQSTYARAAIEKSVSESAKIGESALKLTEQAFAPITARMSLAAEKITKVPAAA